MFEEKKEQEQEQEGEEEKNNKRKKERKILHYNLLTNDGSICSINKNNNQKINKYSN